MDKYINCTDCGKRMYLEDANIIDGLYLCESCFEGYDEKEYWRDLDE